MRLSMQIQRLVDVIAGGGLLFATVVGYAIKK